MESEHSPKVQFRAPAEMKRRVEELAEYHGRGTSEELRLAVACHDARSTLAYLDTPAAVSELGDGLEAAREQVRADLERLERATYRRPGLDPTPVL